MGRPSALTAKLTANTHGRPWTRLNKNLSLNLAEQTLRDFWMHFDAARVGSAANLCCAVLRAYEERALRWAACPRSSR